MSEAQHPAPGRGEMASEALPSRMTQAELAAHWRVSPRTLERWRAEPYGPAWITVGGSIRYRLTDVLAWEAAHLTRP